MRVFDFGYVTVKCRSPLLPYGKKVFRPYSGVSFNI